MHDVRTHERNSAGAETAPAHPQERRETLGQEPKYLPLWEAAGKCLAQAQPTGERQGQIQSSEPGFLALGGLSRVEVQWFGGLRGGETQALAVGAALRLPRKSSQRLQAGRRCQSSDGSEVSETEGALAAQVTRLVRGASEPKPDCSPSSVSPRIPRLEWGSLPRARRESVCAGRVPDPWPTAAQDEEAAHRCAPPGASRPWRERQHRKVGRRTRLEVRRPGKWSWSYSVAPRLTRVPVALTYPISSEHTQRPLQLQYLLLPALPIDSCTANPKFQFRQRDPPQGGSRRLRSVRPPPPPPQTHSLVPLSRGGGGGLLGLLPGKSARPAMPGLLAEACAADVRAPAPSSPEALFQRKPDRLLEVGSCNQFNRHVSSFLLALIPESEEAEARVPALAGVLKCALAGRKAGR